VPGRAHLANSLEFSASIRSSSPPVLRVANAGQPVCPIVANTLTSHTPSLITLRVDVFETCHTLIIFCLEIMLDQRLDRSPAPRNATVKTSYDSEAAAVRRRSPSILSFRPNRRIPFRKKPPFHQQSPGLRPRQKQSSSCQGRPIRHIPGSKFLPDAESIRMSSSLVLRDAKPEARPRAIGRAHSCVTQNGRCVTPPAGADVQGGKFLQHSYTRPSTKSNAGGQCVRGQQQLNCLAEHSASAESGSSAACGVYPRSVDLLRASKCSKCLQYLTAVRKGTTIIVFKYIWSIRAEFQCPLPTLRCVRIGGHTRKLHCKRVELWNVSSSARTVTSDQLTSLFQPPMRNEKPSPEKIIRFVGASPLRRDPQDNHRLIQATRVFQQLRESLSGLGQRHPIRLGCELAQRRPQLALVD
jgi:hypothetical protein